jgi:hypothetical protein
VPLFLAVSLGVGMAALLTRLDSIANGHRQVGGDFESLYGAPWAVLSHLSDAAFGKAWFSHDPLVRSEFALYAGISGTVLALAGAVRGFRDRRVRFLAIFGGSALLAGFVRPLAELLMQIPLLNSSAPSRWVFLGGFSLALLSAEGWDEIARLPGRVPQAIGAAVAIPVLMALLAPFRISWVAVAETAIGGLLALAACLAVSRRPRAAFALGLAALLVDLLPPFLHQNRTAPPLEVPDLPRVESARVLGFPRARAVDPRPWNLSVGNNLLALLGRDAFAGYEAILPATYVDYALAAGGNVAGSGRVAWFDRFDSPLLAAASVRYVAPPDALAPGPRWIPAHGQFYENLDALPQARLVTKVWAAYPPSEAPSLLRSSRVDLRTSVIIEGEVDLPPLDARGGTVTWLDRSSDRVRLHAKSDGRALLVLADTWDEGWAADVDGAATPILRANVMFRAVLVPAGEHLVTFRFRPACARNGLLVTLVSIAGVLAFTARSFLASRRKGATLPSDGAL